MLTLSLKINNKVSFGFFFFKFKDFFKKFKELLKLLKLKTKYKV